MRIAYVVMHVEKLNMLGGVGRKIEFQTSQWRQAGHEVRTFILMPEYRGENMHTYKAYTRLPLVRDLTRMASRSYALTRLIDNVKEYRPDVIYLRCGRYVFPFHALTKVAPIVLEINTKDIDEHRVRGGYFYWSHLFSRRMLFGNVSGFVAVSHEIAELPVNSVYRKPIRVISNGIDLEKYDPLPVPKNDSPVVTMVASPGMAWHGVDKLVALAEGCPDLQFNLVGYSSDNIRRSVPSNLNLPGFLQQADVKAMLAKTDVACSTLALHRNNMEEASTLKVREALAFGIPLILAYRDTDLEGLDADWLLRLPNTPGNVSENMLVIKNFAYRMMGKRVERALIANRINQRAKEQERLVFFAEVSRKGAGPKSVEN
jgi:glycosyltransferase involved in cell wall biosynthesis